MTVAAGPRRLAQRLLPDGWRAHGEAAGRLIEAAARLGYAARGLVYLSVGGVALMAALNATPHAKGSVDSLDAWSDWPLGVALLWLVGLGLYAFAGWRALQSVFDADRLGATPSAVVTRVGKAISGLVYGGLGVSVFGLLDAIEDMRESDDRDATRAAIETALGWPGGDMLVAAGGGVILVAGLVTGARALTRGFTRDLVCGRDLARWASVLARVGYFARGAVMAGAGGLVLRAGLHAKASEARGVGGALDILGAQPGGAWWLGAMGLGLIAFAGFSLMKAGWRRIGC